MTEGEVNLVQQQRKDRVVADIGRLTLLLLALVMGYYAIINGAGIIDALRGSGAILTDKIIFTVVSAGLGWWSWRTVRASV